MKRNHQEAFASTMYNNQLSMMNSCHPISHEDFSIMNESDEVEEFEGIGEMKKIGDFAGKFVNNYAGEMSEGFSTSSLQGEMDKKRLVHSNPTNFQDHSHEYSQNHPTFHPPSKRICRRFSFHENSMESVEGMENDELNHEWNMSSDTRDNDACESHVFKNMTDESVSFNWKKNSKTHVEGQILPQNPFHQHVTNHHDPRIGNESNQTNYSLNRTSYESYNQLFTQPQIHQTTTIHEHSSSSNASPLTQKSITQRAGSISGGWNMLDEKHQSHYNLLKTTFETNRQGTFSSNHSPCVSSNFQSDSNQIVHYIQSSNVPNGTNNEVVFSNFNINVVIQCANGHRIFLTIDSRKNINELKRMIMRKLNIDVNLQRLVFQGKLCPDLISLSGLEITNQSHLYLVTQICGG